MHESAPKFFDVHKFKEKNMHEKYAAYFQIDKIKTSGIFYTSLA